MPKAGLSPLVLVTVFAAATLLVAAGFARPASSAAAGTAEFTFTLRPAQVLTVTALGEPPTVILVNVRSNQTYSLGYRAPAGGFPPGSATAATGEWLLTGPGGWGSDDQVILVTVDHPRTGPSGDDYIFRLDAARPGAGSRPAPKKNPAPREG